MGSRLELQSKLEELLGSRNVYYQPPESLKMKYPAIRYSKEDIDSPKTYDNLYFYVILAMFSTAGIYLTRLKTKGKHFAK